MTVCLSRALKEKERLGTRIQELKQILREENAKETSDERCIDVVDGLRRLKSLKHEICVLKAVIARANQPIVHLLIEMEEWKGLVAVLEAMKKAGVDEVCTRYASNRDCITLKISAAEIREKIASL